MKLGLEKIEILISLISIFTLNNSLMAFTINEKVGDKDSKLKICGIVQINARGGDGVIEDNKNAPIKFGSDTVRLGLKYSVDNIDGKLLLDFNKEHEDKSGIGIPDMVKDAFSSYIVNSALALRVGVMKVPVGMSFTQTGSSLDIVERGFDKALALDRDIGIMLFGRNITLFSKNRDLELGYDILFGNQAGRSGAVINANSGDANAYAIRFMLDYREILHYELSYGISNSAGGIAGFRDDILVDTENYHILNTGLELHLSDINLKTEYFNSRNIQGVKDWNENTLSLTGTYYINDSFELAIKHIQGDASKDEVDTTLGNTYLGFNYYIESDSTYSSSVRDSNHHKLQLNYLIASGDKKEWNGLKGYRDNAILAQYQFKF